MEVLPCSGAPRIGESDCPEPESEAVLKDDGKPVCLQGSDYIRTDLKFDDLTLKVGESNEVRDVGDQVMVEGFPALEGGSNEDTYFEYDLDGQTLSCYSHDSEDDNFEKTNQFADPCLTIENSHVNLNTIEGGLSSNHQEGSPYLEIKVFEQDEPQAVWVKWRGQWQSGIRCARADWPLSTLKAKPTHDRKQYLVIFFPRTRNYSWADVLLVRPINEFPNPIAYKTHQVGIKMVEDLSLARRFIMQKLAVGMLNIIEQLNCEALVESARDAMVLKDFAMEASRCKDYSDLGNMLLKLQNMIQLCYLTSVWLHKSLESWKQRCHDANSAECVEMLKEELADSILWNEVNAQSSEAGQVDEGSDMKSWKHEVMKWFSVSYPIPTSVGLDQPVYDSPLTVELQTPKKRLKLEVRRADSHSSGPHQSVPVETDASFFNGYVNSSLLDAETFKRNSPVEDAVLAGSTSCAANAWDNIVVEAEDLEVTKGKEIDLIPSSVVTQKSTESGSHNRQCLAFIESKGRQCVRYASEGDVYCCVHLSSRFIGNSAKAEVTPPADSPMCGGTTVLGTKCKHRALTGASFCKKHRPHDGKNIASSVNKLKRKVEDNIFHPEGTSPAKLVLSRDNDIPGHLESLLDRVKGSLQENSVSGKTEQPQQAPPSDEMMQCIGSWPEVGAEPCIESPKRHSLYCEQHIPSWLKRARNGKSRIVSKEVFLEMLKNCQSREQKFQLHQACELFYRLFKSILSLRNPVPKEVQFQWAITEASKDTGVGEILMKLVCSEKERLQKLWEFGDGQNLPSSSTVEEFIPTQVQVSKDSGQETVIKCKICLETLPDDQTLGKHWIDSHKKEAQWLFRGYVCAICLDSFTNKKVLEAHVQDRHHVQFVEQCMLLQCIPCGSHFGNPDELWLHVFSVHTSNLRLSNAIEQQDNSSSQKVEANKSGSTEHMKSENQSVNRRFICRFCGLKFDLLPDLGRHHQAAHKGDESGSRPQLTKKGIQYYAHKLKAGRLTRPGFKKSLTSASYKIRNRSVQNLKKRIQAASSNSPMEIMVQSAVPEDSTPCRLADSQCAAIAKILISEIKKTKLRPNNSEILSTASSACCKVSLQSSLEEKYGILPEKLYLKAAKLCSEHNILVEWHQEGFICPKGCPQSRSPILSPLLLSSDISFKARCSLLPNILSSEWTMDECHCVIDSRHLSMDLSEKNIILCDDISFGQEPVSIACVVDENILNAEGPDGQITEYSFPWESFTYVTKPLIDQSLVLELESSQLGCACVRSTCYSETCDHVYLFDNDYEDAKDIYGKPMRGRFPYDERGRIILEEGYLVYECNQRCCCSRSCQNRVLQNGVQVKLEIFKTEKKGWAVRAREAILRGSFVCEYIGEVIDENEANERRNRYSTEGSRYLYEIDACNNDMSRLIEGQVSYVIDATNYGNVSRYINKSCSANLVNHQVVIESMDSKLAHVGLYARRDIAMGEELTYDFRYTVLDGEGSDCQCGASNCRGRPP